MFVKKHNDLTLNVDKNYEFNTKINMKDCTK